MADDDHKPTHSLDELEAWLTDRYRAPVEELHAIRGGYWSSAFGYVVQGDRLVLRLGASDEGYLIDRAAHRFAAYGIPVPEVIDIGRAFDGHYAISRRLEGSFLEEADPDLAPSLGPIVADLLGRLRAVPARPGEGVEWYAEPDAGVESWHAWLRLGLDQYPGSWAAAVSTDRRLADVWTACEAAIEELLPSCPERRDLVHGDLLHQNVLIAPGGDAVTGIFSWKCSARGDFLYDVAWCTLWSEWFPGIGALGLWERTLAADDLGPGDLADATRRHHCYELQIAASHLRWFVESQDHENLARLVDVVAARLQRGPLDL